MYTTRHLSMYRKDPSLLSESPVGTQHSGFLVITDEETEAQDVRFFGLVSDNRVRKFPFPQNKLVNVVHRSSTHNTNGQTTHTTHDKVWFIPVLDQPLSSNRYYVIRAKGKYKGQASTCSKEEDMAPCCFWDIVNDVKARDLDYRDIYQQVEIFKQRRGGYTAKSITPGGFPPWFLRRKGWTVETSSSFECQLSDAHGLNFALREKLPEFNFPISNKRSTSLVVGKWYCPFVFIKDHERLKDQMENSLLYEMTMEQWWEEIYTCKNDYNGTNTISFSVKVQKEVNSLFGMEAVKDYTHGAVETIWYKLVDSQGGSRSLGLSKAIVDKMTLVQEMGGWVRGNGKDVEVTRTEEFKEGKEWQRFGCFVLVERFSLRRLDGTLLLKCDFRHTQHIQSKWE